MLARRRALRAVQQQVGAAAKSKLADMLNRSL